MDYERQGPAGWAVHPGEILKIEFLRPMKITAYRLAKSIGVKAQTISDIVLEKRGVSADLAIRLGRFFGNGEQFWMNLQSSYEIAKAYKQNKREFHKIRPFKDAAA